MFQDLLLKIESTTRDKGIDRYISRVWVYRQTCVVVDLIYKKVKFALDFTPEKGERVHLDLVERYKGSALTVSGTKDRVAVSVTLDQALDVALEKLCQVFSLIDRQTNSTIDTDKHAVISSEKVVSVGHKTQVADGSLKVGVLTLPLNDNYGGNLQAYALMEVLRGMGHTPVLINRRNPPKAGSAVSARTSPEEKPLITNKIAIRAAENRAFVQRHLRPITREFTSSQQLAESIDQYNFDAMIVGSDQVWRPKYSPSLPDYFLDFLRNNSHIRKISYAASFGAPRWEFDASQTSMASSALKRFDAVSVREDIGVALCGKNLAVEAEHVLDPTLLLTQDHYAKLYSGKAEALPRNGILVYVLDQSDDKTQVVETLSKSLSLPVFSTKDNFAGISPEFRSKPFDKSVESWLLGFHQADFVVTDSFHGTVFSILFNKPFIAYGNPARGMARFTSLLKMFGLEDRLIVASREADFSKLLRPIDWNDVNIKLRRERDKAMDFLRSALLNNSESNLRHQVADTSSAEKYVNPGKTHPLNVLCTGCGVCVSESDDTLEMKWNEDGFRVPYAKAKRIPIRAIKVCPFNPAPDSEVEDEDALAKLFLPEARQFDERVGRFENTYAGYSKEFRRSSSSGGLATYVFKKLLEKGHVEYLFVVESDGADGYKYKRFDKSADITSVSKTRYFPVSLEELFALIEHSDGRVAVSGVACFIKAVRLKQFYNPELRRKIAFLVGLICGGLKSKLYTDFLAQSAGIKGEYTNPEYRIKDAKSSATDYSFGALDHNKKLQSIKMPRLGDMWGSGLFKAKACDFCTDVLTELADISLGDAWLPQYRPDGLGTSVIVTRSKLADQIIRDGMASGELAAQSIHQRRVIQSQGASFSHRQNAVKLREWMARTSLDIDIPHVRKRVLRSVSLAYSVVQIQRERTRSQSLELWKANPNIQVFNNRMRRYLKTLRSMTEFYHVENTAKDDLVTLLRTPDAVMSVSSKRAEKLLIRSQSGFISSAVVARWILSKARSPRRGNSLLREVLLDLRVVHIDDATMQILELAGVTDAPRIGLSSDAQPKVSNIV